MSTDQVPPNQKQRDEIRKTVAPRVVSEPLKSKIESELLARTTQTAAPPPTPYEVIIEVNLNNPGGRTGACERIRRMIEDILGSAAQAALSRNLEDSSHPYLFARLTADQIIDVVKRDGDAAWQEGEKSGKAVPRKTFRCIFRIWESQRVQPLITESVRTVKANAAHNSFGAFGEGIVWAVLDSGIDANHPHFGLHQNLSLPAPLTDKSRSFSANPTPWDQDAFGHGTHVAGIIAGEARPGTTPLAAIESPDESGNGEFHLLPIETIKGMAPKTKLLILRVLDDNGDGDEIALLQAIEYIQQLNDYGRHLVVHGVNISAGFPAHPTWYACGQTPLCVEINRLMKSGVAAVVAAGNSGHIVTFLNPQSTVEAGQLLSINDPGNAELAITVGSTHRQSPHTYGVSYFSSKGPTSDGRRKPDVVAPGEKIISSASSYRQQNATLPGLDGAKFDYIEDTGTSMAAPHVSGVLASFLSIKREFIGQPEEAKKFLMQSALDLGRDVNIQGAGLVDLMKLIQSV
jgi:serine protease AprX